MEERTGREGEEKGLLSLGTTKDTRFRRRAPQMAEGDCADV